MQSDENQIRLRNVLNSLQLNDATQIMNLPEKTSNRTERGSISADAVDNSLLEETELRQEPGWEDQEDRRRRRSRLRRETAVRTVCS